MATLNINNIRKNVVTNLIKETYEGILTDADLSVRINEAVSNVNGGNMITGLRLQSGVTDADSVSATMSELFVDLSTSYETINTVDSKIVNTLESSLSNINKINDDIDKANTIVDEYESFMRARGNPAYRIEKFNNKSSFETDMSLYRERYNEKVGAFTAGVYDEACSSIILPKLRSSNMAYYSDGVLAAKVSLSRQFGSANAELKTNSNDVNNILTPSNKEVWNESILVDEPIRITENNIHYSINSGALFEVEIDFESVTVINEILISPFGKYPVDILSIRYSISGSIDEEHKYLVSANSKDSSLRPRTLIDPIVYRFQNTLVKKIYITMNQLHYVRNSFIYNTTNNLLNNVLYSLKSSNLDLSSNANVIFKPIYKDRVESNAAWMLINDLLIRDSEVDISKILFTSEGKNRKALKYHYSYGLTSVEPRNNEFDRCGVYVSKPIDDVGNIRSIKIVTDEVHPINRQGNFVTDVEYYITHTSNPKWHDWKSILPANKERIELELLQMYDQFCELRFEAKTVEAVYIDGILLEERIDYFLRKNSNGLVYAIEIPDFDFLSTYTVTYVPDRKYSILDLSDVEKATSVEEFNGDGESFFSLKNNIYLSSDADDTYVRIIDINTGAVIASGDSVKCVTDPYSSYDSYKNFDNRNGGYEYYTHKNYVYFNKPIGKELKVEVSYKHYVNQIRLKAILRRNTKYDKHITPTVNSIKYEIVTAE